MLGCFGATGVGNCVKTPQELRQRRRVGKGCSMLIRPQPKKVMMRPAGTSPASRSQGGSPCRRRRLLQTKSPNGEHSYVVEPAAMAHELRTRTVFLSILGAWSCVTVPGTLI